MAKKKTTFVLGAGVSQDYGYPSGRQLNQHVIDTLRKTFPDLSDRIRGCAYGSIDRFIQQYPDDKNKIKPIIAAKILASESETWFRDMNDRKDLYVWLLNLFESNGWENFNIVTFNYDRLLEQFFFFILKSRYAAKSNADIFKMIYSMNIIHVFGRMPPLPGEEPFLKMEGVNVRRYAMRVHPNAHEEDDNVIRHGIHHLRTIHEAESKEANSDQLAAMIAESGSVVFLGCAYHPENIALLRYNFHSNGSHKALWGTKVGLESDLERRMLSLIKFTDNTCLNLPAVDLVKRIHF